MSFLLSVYLLSAITQTNKQKIYSFNDIQFPGLHIIQYYNIYNTVIIMMIIIETIKTIYIEDYLHCTKFGNMTHKENLAQCQNYF